MLGQGVRRLPARLKFMTEKPPHLIQHLVDQMGPGPRSTRFDLALFSPVQRKRERDQPRRAVGHGSPEQAQHRADANGHGKRYDRVLD